MSAPTAPPSSGPSSRTVGGEPDTARRLPTGPARPPDAGRGWYPADAERHRRDAPRFCPACAAALQLADGGHGLTTEYWVGADRVFVCYCGACDWWGDIVLPARVLGHEPEQ